METMNNSLENFLTIVLEYWMKDATMEKPHTSLEELVNSFQSYNNALQN
jgi:hypothetical protein